MSFAKEILQGILWNHVGKILEYALMYVFSVLVARGLGAEGYGTYITFFTVAQFLLLVSGLGFESALIRSASQYTQPQDYPRLRYLVRHLVRWRVLALVAAVVLSYHLRLEILHFLSIPESALRYLVFIFFYVGLKSLVPLFLSLFVAQLNTRMVSAISVSARALEVAAVLYFLSHGYGLEAIFFIIIGGAAYSLIGCLIFARKNLFGGVERENTKPVIALGMTLWANLAMSYILEKQGDIILLNALLGDRKEVGYYDVSFGLVQAVVYGLTIGFSGVSLAAFSRLANSNTQMFGEAWKFSVKLIILLLLPALIFLAVHADVLVPAIYSSEYERSVGLFQLFVLFQITARLFGSGVNADVLISVNKANLLLGFGILAGLLNILLNLLLIPSFRAYGAVIATGVANTAVVAMSAAYILKKFSISLSVGFWVKVVAISVASAYIGKMILHPATLPTILLSGLVYAFLWGLLAFALKPFAREDIEMMKKFNFRVSEWAAHFAWT